VDTHEIVESIIDIIHIPKHITITIKNRLPIIKADRYRIQQLFQNIIGMPLIILKRNQVLVEIASEEFDMLFFC
jgi:light-regulated signal transduction histidine kinase (bacteriophytochrome)